MSDIQKKEADVLEPPGFEDVKTDKLDVGAQILAGHDRNFTPQEEKKLLWKIDLRLMPLAAWCCGLQFVDKASISAAATYGMREDLNLHGQEFSWAVAIFYFGYLTGALFIGRLLQYFHCGKFIGGCLFAWGITLLGMIGVQNFAGIMVLRYLLGVFESSLAPGLLLITTMWYRPKEQPFRFGIWTVCNGLLPIPFLLVYYGIGHIENGFIPNWRIIYFVLGLVTVVTGVITFFLLPDNPATVKWLNEREKMIALERMAQSQTGVKNKNFKWDQLKEALLDARTWLMVGIMFFSQAGGNVTTNFLGVIINGFGFSPLRTQLMQMPNFAIQTVITLVITALPTFVAALRSYKAIIGSIAVVGAVAGTALVYANDPRTSDQGVLLAGMYLVSLNNGTYTQAMAIIGANVAGFTKKHVVTSLSFGAYCLVNIVVPQSFLGSESPTYHTGLCVVMSFLAACFVCMILLHILMVAENRRRDKLDIPAEDDELAGLKDETDKQNLRFRYSP